MPIFVKSSKIHNFVNLYENCNHAPVVSAEERDFTASPGETIVLKAAAEDPDGDACSFAWSADPTGGVYKAADMKDKHLAYGPASAMAKLYAAETAMFVTTKCVQLHGGYGYTKDYPVERMMRDAKITEIYEGTSEVQRMVIAASVLGK